MTENQTEEPFLNWIIQNQEAIKNGSAVYEGERVTPSSEGVRFETCISCFIVTMRKKTPQITSHYPKRLYHLTVDDKASSIRASSGAVREPSYSR